MRWKEPLRGWICGNYEYRVIKHFLFLPRNQGDETRWLEFSRILQKRIRTENTLGIWWDEGWYDK